MIFFQGQTDSIYALIGRKGFTGEQAKANREEEIVIVLKQAFILTKIFNHQFIC